MGAKIPSVNCQERTRDELLTTLEITLRETIECNREEAHRGIKSQYFLDTPVITFFRNLR